MTFTSVICEILSTVLLFYEGFGWVEKCDNKEKYVYF